MSTGRRITRGLLVGAVGAAGVLLPVTASAAPYPGGGTPPEVLPSTQQRTTTVANAGTSRSTLPFTGGDIAGIAALGLAAAGTGAVLVRRSRRHA